MGFHRKRVHAIRIIPRGPDGSAFQQCESCGLSVAISLADMHECGATGVYIKKARTDQCRRSETRKEQRVENSEDLVRFQDQPRSAFRLFMEEFVKACHDEDEIDVDRRGFETWRNMSRMERQPYELRAEKICSAYLKCLIEEENNMPKVDDVAESVEVKNYEESYEDVTCSDDSDGLLSYSDESKNLINSYLKWKLKHAWLFR